MSVKTETERPPLLALRGKPVRLPWTRGFWACTALIATFVALVGAFEIGPRTAPALRFGGTTGWIYEQDATHVTAVRADGAEQLTVPIRRGQRQGFYIDVYNPSSRSQTVAGLAPNTVMPGGYTGLRLEIGTTGTSYSAGDLTTTGFANRVSIPPHQMRWLKVSWLSTDCLDPDVQLTIDSMSLNVKVGGISRVERLGLHEGIGVSSQSVTATTRQAC
ncbi:MAG: hypothetical protein ACRDV3_04655 [Acidothermaceae bacterium]